jgi:O-antigen ligase
MHHSLSLIYARIQKNTDTIANHILVIIAFFLPINAGAVKSGFFILIVLLLFKKDLWKVFKETLSNPVVISFLLIWLLHKIGILYSFNPAGSAKYASEMTFFLYPALILIFVEYRYIYRIFTGFILGVFLSELLSYSFFFELLTSPIPEKFGGFILASKNEPSPFTYHIEYGFILAITSALLLQRFIVSAHRSEKLALILFFTTISLNVFLNSARTGYIIFFIANLAVLLSIYKTQFIKRFLFLLPIGLFVIFIAWNFSTNLKREFYETTDSVQRLFIHNDMSSSIGNRVSMATAGFSALKDHYWIGFGTGTQGHVVYDEAVKEKNTQLIQWMPEPHFYMGYKMHLDCNYVDVLIQFGIIGLFIFLNLFVQMARYHNQDSSLNHIRSAVLWSGLFYALISSLLFGFLLPVLYVVLTTFTLVQPNGSLPSLPKENFRHISLYALLAISLFFISKVT